MSATRRRPCCPFATGPTACSASPPRAAPRSASSNGQFTMMGLETDGGRPLVRAYSMASPNYEDTLEFFSIKVPDGPLTSRLQHIKQSDRILVSKKPTGTLVVDNLLPGRFLYLLSTGTGLAPFMQASSAIPTPTSGSRRSCSCTAAGEVAELAYGGASSPTCHALRADRGLCARGS